MITSCKYSGAHSFLILKNSNSAPANPKLKPIPIVKSRDNDADKTPWLNPKKYSFTNKINYLIVVNDLSWFLGSSFNTQYNQIAKFVAVSSQKPVIISSNYGTSVWIDYNGKVLKSFKARSKQSGVESTSIYKGETPIGLYGDFIVVLASIIIGVIDKVMLSS